MKTGYWAVRLPFLGLGISQLFFPITSTCMAPAKAVVTLCYWLHCCKIRSAVCADLPFLTSLSRSNLEGDAYRILQSAFHSVPPTLFWNRLGYIDTLSHAHRLTMPVMLSSGGKDTVCPPRTVQKLFDALPGTRQDTYLEDNIHTHSRQSMYLLRNWLALFALCFYLYKFMK